MRIRYQQICKEGIYKMRGLTNSVNRGGVAALPYNANYPYKVNDVCIHNGELWRCDKVCTGIEPGTDYNCWNVNYSNKNLLDNWDFTNPVNQRGQSIYSGGSYGPDRWICGTDCPSAQFILGANGITIKRPVNSAYNLHMVQKMESNNIFGNELTASVLMSDGKIYAGSIVCNPSSDNTFFFSIKDVLNVFYQTYAADNVSKLQFVINNITFKGMADEFTIKAAKLEYGSVSTLKNDLLGVSYAEELRKCQRYYQRFNNTSNTYHNTLGIAEIHVNNKAYLPLNLIVPMKSTPVITFNNVHIQTHKDNIECAATSILNYDAI